MVSSDAPVWVAIFIVIVTMAVLAFVGVIKKRLSPALAIAALAPVLYALLRLLER